MTYIVKYDTVNTNKKHIINLKQNKMKKVENTQRKPKEARLLAVKTTNGNWLIDFFGEVFFYYNPKQKEMAFPEDKCYWPKYPEWDSICEQNHQADGKSGVFGIESKMIRNHLHRLAPLAKEAVSLSLDQQEIVKRSDKLKEKIATVLYAGAPQEAKNEEENPNLNKVQPTVEQKSQIEKFKERKLKSAPKTAMSEALTKAMMITAEAQNKDSGHAHVN